ncbi:hypothetical protein D3C86_1340020 [compost metagenome]
MQLVDAADLAQHGLADLHAVVDLRGGGEVQQHARHLGILVAHIGPADQVGVVFLVGEPTGGRTGRTPLGQREHGRPARLGRQEGIGVDRHEQVGLHAPRLLHAHVQRHEEVRVARHHRAHIGLGVDLGAQPVRDLEHHVLLARAGRANGAGVLAAVTGVQGHGQQAAHLELAGRRHIGLGHRRRHRRRRGGGRGRRLGPHLRDSGRRRRGGGRQLVLVIELAHQRANRIFLGPGRRAGHALAACRRRVLGEAALLVLGIAHQLPERIGRIHRVEIEHEPVAVAADRGQREHLRRDVFLEVEHHPHHARPVLAHAHGLDIGVVGADLGHQLAQRGREVEAVDIHHQTVRAADHLVLRGQRRIGLDGHARVILGGPDAHGHDAGAARDLRADEGQHHRAGAQPRSLRHPLAPGLQQSVGSIGSVGGESLDQHAFSRISPVGV